jgi:hypothetical protein
MDAGLAGLIGAGVGASATLVGTVLAGRQQATERRETGLYERKEVAYNRAIRSVLRAMNRRSMFEHEGGRLIPIIAKEDVGVFFDDLIDAQHGVAMVSTACGEEQQERVLGLSTSLDAMVREVALGNASPALPNLTDTYKELLGAAQADLARAN